MGKMSKWVKKQYKSWKILDITTLNFTKTAFRNGGIQACPSKELIWGTKKEKQSRIKLAMLTPLRERSRLLSIFSAVLNPINKIQTRYIQIADEFKPLTINNLYLTKTLNAVIIKEIRNEKIFSYI